jgi:alkanesulfonate monooxygenase SsuD/methylene tetrahydromethanopterin reductase-like flavin-dependent oxidoreductase (luciferase family)
VGTAAFAAMVEHRSAMRRRVMAAEGEVLPGVPAEILPGAVPEGLMCGSPASVAAKVSHLAALGVGGLILQFRLGPMRVELAQESLELFAREVMPQVRGPALAAAT